MAKGRLVIGTAPKRRVPLRAIALGAAALLVLSLALTRLVFFELVRVRGNTMAPAAMHDDILLVANLGRPGLGAVVLLEDRNREVLRRVVGVPGDRMATAEGVLTRNGVPLETTPSGVFETYEGKDETDRRPHGQTMAIERFADGRGHGILGDHDGAARPWRFDLPEIEVPPGHVFVLCDNRRTCPLDDASGVVALDRIAGVARSVMWYGEARVVPPPDAPFYGAFYGLASTASVAVADDSTASPRK